jgi:hypothetical protein
MEDPFKTTDKAQESDSSGTSKRLKPDEVWYEHTGAEWEEIAKSALAKNYTDPHPNIKDVSNKPVSPERAKQWFAHIRNIIENARKPNKEKPEYPPKPISSADAYDRWQRENDK